ncbi:ANTAR domain-containing protein [Arthrobacter ruber]|uniref:ANTAR domain-containing protein n=1 Tax=Arthrobacter ruber TaxID=1258893 RepID=UPI00130005C5|nr:ANTAR domain-containing protein [Arthrobacter ruber]
MPQVSDDPTHAPPRLFPAANQNLHLPPLVGGLSDRQAVIAAMVAGGHSCHDIAADLLLPLRAVQGHLYEAITTLGLSSVAELTPAVLAVHSITGAPTASVGTDPAPAGSAHRPAPDPGDGPGPTGPSAEPLLGSLPEPSLSGSPVSSVAVLIAEEAAQVVQEPELDATLSRELAATRMLLQQKVDKLQELQTALRSRDTIGQAKGILMERHRISAHRAFTILQEESSRSSTKLVNIAEDLIHAGGEGVGG